MSTNAAECRCNPTCACAATENRNPSTRRSACDCGPECPCAPQCSCGL